MSDHVAPVHKTLWQSAWDNPILLLALTALIWAGHSVVGRLAVGQIAPMTLTTARWALALGPIMWAARGTLRRDLKVLRPHWLFVGAMGALGFTGFNALFYAAAHSTGALNMSIIQGAIPALVLIGARLAFGVRITAMQALGTLATMIGVAAIAAHGEWSRLATFAFSPGDLLHAARHRLLRLLHFGPARASRCLRARLSRRDGLRGAGDLDPVVRR